MVFLKLVYIGLAILVVWSLLGYLRDNPEALSRANLSRGTFALGWLALALIGVVAILVGLIKR